MSGKRWGLLVLAALLAGCGEEEEDRVASVLALEGDAAAGETLYGTECAGCHGASGEGGVGPAMDSLVPALSPEAFVEVTIYGFGESMPAHEYLTDQEVADIYTWLSENFGG